MSIELEGTIERQDLGAGAWALISTEGQTYELFRAPHDLRQPGLRVRVTGDLREDVMTTAMIGPVLQVKQFECL